MSANSDEDFWGDDNAEGETRDENIKISVNWSSKLEEIHIEKFIEMYGVTNDLGTNTMAKEFSIILSIVHTLTRQCRRQCFTHFRKDSSLAALSIPE